MNRSLSLLLLAAAAACAPATATRAQDKPDAGGKDAAASLFPVRQAGKWGYIDDKGTVVIKPQFDCAWDFRDGLAMVTVGQKRGFIAPSGQIVIQPKYYLAWSFSEGFAPVYENAGTFGQTFTMSGQWKLIDRKGETVGRPNYARLSRVHEGVVRAKTAGAFYGSVQGRMISNWLNEGMGDFSEGLAAVKLRRKWGFIDHSIRFVIANQFDDAEGFSDGVAAVCTNKAWGYIARPEKIAAVEESQKVQGEGRDMTSSNAVPAQFVIEPKYERAGPFSEGLAGVKLQGKWGIIDKTGKPLVEPSYEFVAKFSEGLCRVVKDNKSGYVDKTGSVVIGPTFDAGWDFSGGLARVVVGGKEGYINKTGAFAWQPQD